MKIEVFDDLLNFKELLPDYVSHITYSLDNRCDETLLRNKGVETVSNIDLIKPKFSSIYISQKNIFWRDRITLKVALFSQNQILSFMNLC